jgi:uncharacterized protein (TIGR03083 family)
MNPGGSPKWADYLGHLAAESARFVDVLAQAPAGTAVPTCPDWDVDDLLWHLGTVQWFWATIVNRGLTLQAQVDGLQRPARPATREQLLVHFGRASADLQANLARKSPDTPAWTWSNQQDVAFIGRRQAHEALIHRLDAELATGARTPMDADLSADGLDEVLGFIASRDQQGARFIPDPARTVAIQATDTSRSWVLGLGQLSGSETEPARRDEAALVVTASGWRGSGASAPPAATISGAAADLDVLFWHRPALGDLQRAGDPATLDLLEQIIARDQD